MRILISNDDGINAHGIKILEKAAHEITDDVWVVAPELDQSGVSHALTLRNPLRIREIGHQKFAVSGTPTDCVHMAVCHLMKDKAPDLVISGVNYGANIAEDISYSGTAAVGLKATLMGIPSVAFSLAITPPHPPKWATADHYVLGLLKQIIDAGIPEKILINVNFPDVVTASVKGLLFTQQGVRKTAETVIEGIDPRGKPYYWIGPANHNYDGYEQGTDLWAISNGYVSITPLSIERTHFKTLHTLQGAFRL